MNAPQQQLPALPLGALAVNVVGTLMLAAGVAGLFAPAAVSAVPALADPVTAWTLTVTGLALDAWSTLTIVRSLRVRR
jgi:fluoride ion exporter CrcB/FEX